MSFYQSDGGTKCPLLTRQNEWTPKQHKEQHEQTHTVKKFLFFCFAFQKYVNCEIQGTHYRVRTRVNTQMREERVCETIDERKCDDEDNGALLRIRWVCRKRANNNWDAWKTKNTPLRHTCLQYCDFRCDKTNNTAFFFMNTPKSAFTTRHMLSRKQTRAPKNQGTSTPP